MSYYKPSFSQTLAMARGRGFSSPRGNSYRGGSSRGNSWGGNAGRGGYSPGGGRFGPSFSMDSRGSFESRGKYGGSGGDRFSRPHPDDYHKSYRDSSYMGRESSRRSPERKRMRMEAPGGSRHDSSYGSAYGSGRHEPPSSYSDRRGYSGERHSSTPYGRKEDFRRSGPPMRGTYRGRLSSRGSRGLRARDRPGRRRLIESSYAIRKRVIPRSGDFNRRLKITRMRSTIVRRTMKRKLSGDKEGDEDEGESDDKDMEKKEGEEGEKAGEETTGEEGDEKIKKEGEKKEIDSKSKKRGFIKLHCPHCNIKCITFRKYEIHLSSKMHMIAMRKIALKQKSILAQMRQAQRKSQNELEKSSEDLSAKTNFCPLCKLNYKQKKSVHQLSESHKNMKKFLMPFCKVCNVTFKSPMIFESHICSIDHMKRKQRMENAGADASADENDLENFTTIDSVGDGDDEEKKDDDSKDALINVGIEQIRKIEAHYCDLCKMYLPRGDEDEMAKILTRHCKQRVHMQRYIRFKERQNLEKRAEKLQRKELAEKIKIKKEGDNNPDVNGDENVPVKTESAEDKIDNDGEDKLWADVDKDLGDILAEAESGNKSSDEDEEDSHVNGERYDRFKLSEKSDDTKLMKEDEESILDIKPEDKESVSEQK